MSTIIERYEQLDKAYKKKTLRLLQSHHSQVYLALFAELFPDASQGVEAEALYSHIDECLTDLAEAGYEDLLPHEAGKVKHGRAVCHDLIDRYNWVESKVTQDGAVEYRLTSDAIEALDTIERLRTTETVMSGSRMRTILDQIDRTYLRLSPDYNTRLRILQQRVADALDELDRYEAAGGSEPISPEEARDEVANLVDLMSGIPVDLRRLEEDIRANASSLIVRFREDERPTGQIIGDYIHAGRHLLEETDHGRSFQDSVSVIGSTSLAGDVDSKLDAIADSPALADNVWEHTRQIQDGWNQIVAGVTWVNRESTRSTHTINRSVSSHDVTRDRELTRVLKELESAAYAWAKTVGPREQAPLLPSVTAFKAHTLRDQPYAPPIAAPPPSLVIEESLVPTLSLEELRRIGGPLTGEVLDAMAATMPLDATSVDLAEAFGALPRSTRRPVELAGILQLARNLAINLASGEQAEYACVDLDGHTVLWRGPKIRLTTAQIDEGRNGRA